MKLNKLILPIALITPLFSSSCDKGGTYSGLTIDAHEMIYAYSQISSTTITISDSLKDVYFVDDFKSEYFTFDNPDDFKGKTYTISKTGSKQLTVNFFGAYTGLELSKTESKDIKYKISKSAFKNNKLKDDATGKISMNWDELRATEQNSGVDSINFDCQFTYGTGGTDLTKIALNPILTEISDINLKNYTSQTGLDNSKIAFSKVTKEGSTELRMSLTGLPTGQHGYSFNIQNSMSAFVFDNLPINYGLKFDISRGAGAESVYTLKSFDLYFEKAV